GTSILLKVMAGDKIAVNAENFYEQLQSQPEDIVSSEAVMSQVLNAMAGGAAATTGSEGAGANILQTNTDPAALQSAYEALQAAETDSSKPRSYLNYLFFDEHMKVVAEHSRLWQADGAADWKTIGTEEAIEIPENGYIAVYLSNQGAEQVYYDNLAVTLTPGALLEEKHYYPYGLPIQGWGTTASGSLPNRQRYQGNEYREEAGLNWMDFHNRQYDPQLGRFLALDALAAAGGQQVLSPYHAMGCNPAMMVDPLGLQSGEPGSLLTGGNVPGSSGWGAISGYYKSSLVPQSQRPLELQGMLGAMAMMRILSGDAAGYATRTSGGGSGMLTSYEQLLQISYWQKQWSDETKRRGNGSRKYFSAGQGGFFSEETAEDLIGATIDGFDLKENIVKVTLANGGGSNYSIAYEGTDFHLQEDIWSDIWNSNFVRGIIPDKISISIGGDIAFGVGVGAQPLNFTLLTRGKEPGIYLTPTFNITVGITAKAEGSVNFSTANYTGDPRNINSSMVTGITHAGAISFKALGGVSVGMSWAPTGDGEGFIGKNVGIGVGIGFSLEYQRQSTPGVMPLWQW
ncbi:RHS repeat-associated core domain-containing protein, partial [Spirosoma sp. 48-14]|uniref:RHS repeat domain-containing protein n=1 Tax=Spirosoma sp. 48-14 TaxID=1895854 RepID=UPI000A4662C3